MSRAASSHRPRAFLPEVQALRAIAVLGVLVWHFYPRAAPGGFVGVDIFFVISGFLITSKLLRDAEEQGRVDLGEFWAGRIRRIMPASVVTVLAVIAATFLWFPTAAWQEVSKQSMASLLSVENWVLAFDSVDYLAADNKPTALQHFWSLGVEEQFYLVWPLLVILAIALHGRIGTTARSASAVFFAIIVIASFVWAEYSVRSGDPAAYFSTFTRVWELGVGGLLAAAMPHIERLRARCAKSGPAGISLDSLLALVGLGAMLWAIILYTEKTPFPGATAALPVLGAAAVIIAGRTAGALSLNHLFDWAPVQWVGKVSYSLYLWHWPVFIVFVQLTGKNPRWWQAALLTLLSLALAHLSWRFVEEPARHWSLPKRTPKYAFRLGAAATIISLGLAFIPAEAADVVNENLRKEADALLAADGAQLGARSWDQALEVDAPGYRDAGDPVSADASAVADSELAGDVPRALPGGRAITPLPTDAIDDKSTDGSCFSEVEADYTPRCVEGNENGKKTVALVGDSHAQMLLEPLRSLAEDKGWKIITYTKASCPMSLVPRTLDKAEEQCIEPNEQTLKSLAEDKPDVIITQNFSLSTYRSDAVKGFEESLRALKKTGAQVVVVRDTPILADNKADPPTYCVSEYFNNPSLCSKPRGKALLDDPSVTAAHSIGGVRVVDFTDRFCSKDTCPAVAGNVLIYRDKNHVSNTYFRTLQPVFDERISRAVD